MEDLKEAMIVQLVRNLRSSPGEILKAEKIDRFEHRPGESVPEHLRESIRAWVNYGAKPGHHLWGIITRDLEAAVFGADDRSLAGLRATVSFFHNEISSMCWGNEKVARAWQAAHMTVASEERAAARGGSL